MSLHHRQIQQQLHQQQLLQQQHQQQMAENDAAALAAEIFDHFCVATTMRQVLGLYRNMCDTIGLRPAPLNEFYPKLKEKIRNWKAQALWKKFDTRAAHRVYNKGNACPGTRVLVIGAGPCGLRTAIEAQLLGAKVVVVEKRDRISRNNVLHLWPFVITDLRNLGAKKFYGKFCAGSIDHISIRQLQCILLKVALLLGVEVHEGVSFISTIEPSDGYGWRAQVSPEDHAVSHYEFDVLIGADGKRNTLEAFKRKEFRGKLAIAITANFINKKTEAEAKAEEISGVAFIFNQSFFKELYQTTGIDLENIVYYKDETHYFVMTAKKHSLIDKGVIIQDFADPAELLASQNVNTDKLLDYAREAAEFSTKYQMPNLEFAVNHYGKPDVAMFDFTSMFAAETSCRVLVRKNYRLLQCLVGDSLLEPFWPTGSGCARGFLSSMDSAYAIKLWSNSRNSILGVLAQRESIYRLLAQTTPENLQRDIGAYTVDPGTRYPNLNKSTVNVWQVKHLIDTDDPAVLEQTFMDTNVIQASGPETPIRRKRRTGDTLPLSTVLLRWIKAQLHSLEFSEELAEVSECFTSGKVLCALINRYRPDLIDLNILKDCTPRESNELAFKILETELGIPRVMSSKDSVNLENVESKIWLNYLEQVCEVFRGEIPHVKHPKLDFAEFKEGKNTNNVPDFSKLLKLSSKKKSPLQDIDVTNIVHRKSVLDEDKVRRQRKYGADSNQPQLDTTTRRAKKRRSHEKSGNVDRERGIQSSMPRGAADEQFSDRIKNMEQRITSRNASGNDKKPKDLLRAIGKIESTDWNIREIEKKIEQSKKTEIGKSREKVPKWTKEQFIARQNKMSKPIERQESTEEKFKDIDQTLKNLDKQLKEGSILEIGQRGKNKVASIAGQFVKKDDTSEEKNVSTQKSSSKVGLVFNKQAASEKCHFCKQTVYLMEKISTEGLILHRSCLKCYHCHTNLRLGGYAFDRDDPVGRFYCTQHFRLPAKPSRPMVRKSTKQQKKDANDQNKITGDDLKTPVRGRPDNVAQLDLLDRGQTPERIEFENVDAMSDGEPSLEHIIDENEWTDRNFITGSEDSESDLSSSDSSDEESDSDMFEEANGSPIGAQTLQLATDWIGKQRYSNMDDSDEDFYDSSDGLMDDDADSQTEGEEFKKAREMRRQEVKLLPPPANLPTDTETEVQTDSESSSPELNSATEISTDSEFEHDPIIHEAPRIFIDDTHLRKPTKVQIKQGVIMNSPSHRFSTTINKKQHNTTIKQQTPVKPQKPKIELEFKPLVQVDPSLLITNRQPLKNPNPGDYMLNKTASTEGIASRKSLELKKRYLLGEQGIGNGIMKSGSTSILDTKFKSFHSNISECQKLLNPSTDITASMKTFLDRTKILDNNLINNKNDLKNSDNEKENRFVNNQNDINKGMEYSETINATLVETITKNLITPPEKQTTPTPIIETIDLISPEKQIVPIIDLTIQIDTTPPSKLITTKNHEFLNNNIVDLTFDNTPIKTETKNLIDKPDISKDIKETIPDIINQIDDIKHDNNKSTDTTESIVKNQQSNNNDNDDEIALINKDNNDIQDTCIQVPNIPWNLKTKNHPLESDSLSNSSTSSLEEIPHYILDSTTSPDTQNGLEQIVPRLEIHDSSGTLMQIDSLMIIDGKYVGDPEDLKHMAIPEGTRVDTIPEKPELDENLIKTNNKRPDLKFDTKNENKIDSLKNLPLIIDKDDKKKLMKPQSLDLEITKQHQQLESPNDKDKTPTAETNIIVSDSETEMTGQVLTETELSDWTADDAVSENFVDLEFVLNSNKGTIKRNKKDKKKLQSPKTINMKTNSNNDKKILETASSKQQCGILKNLDIEEIEFMDTGSEGSCAEAYSATNKTMLQNRGYIQFIDNHTSEIDNRQTIKSYDRYENDCKQQQQQKRQQEQKEQQDSYQNNIESSSMAKEIPGIDYIEQGACILNNDIDLKTPVNEISPPIFPTKLLSQQIDNLNDIDDDSLVLITSQGTTTGTTTEESDALTVVTSPLDSSPFNHDNNVITPTPTPTPMTTIIFDRMDKQNSIPNSKIPIRKSSIENKRLSQEDLLLTKRKDSDELSYEEYVRKLQLKITQISNARDSIDIRKQKRKSSKGDISDCCTQNNSVIENNINKSLSIFEPTTSSVIQKTIETQQSYVDEPEETEEHIELPTPTPTVSSKLEELTKERTKQKDLIHDLVMDKLQSKKQLNAEKRLNRSRNRSLFNANGGLMTSPKITQQTTSINDNGDCTNSPHYHAKSSENYNKSNDNQQQQYHRKLSPKDNKDIVQMFTKSLSATTTPLTTTPLTTTPTAAGRLKQRPLSDNLDMIQPIKSTIFDQEQQPQQKYGSKITKTQSFCVYTTPMISSKSSKLEDSSILSTNTDKLRAEARARARLKSNHDLGLSPEEKLRLLRKRYNLDMNDIIGGSSEITTNPNGNSSSSHNNQSDDMKVRDRKMITSKSVNDITTVQNLLNSDENFDTNDSMKMNKIDFTSDPNLTNSQETSGTGTGTQKVRRSASARKDPERRKSIIKTVSDFFHKKKDKDSTTQSTATASTTPTKEKADGVFSRFKISPKSKEKSKEKDGSPCYDQNKSQDYPKYQISSYSSSPQLFKRSEEVAPPPIPPLPLNYQRSDDESYTNESREQKKQRAISKASRQAELKRLRIAQEIQREQEEIEVKLKELEARGVLIEKALRGEGQNMENLETSSMGASDEKLLKELLEIWGNITQLKKRDEELGIRQQELQLEHRHAQLKEELNMRLSFSKLDKSSADVAAEGAILNEMLEIVAKRAALRPNETTSTTIGRQLIENDSED